jgi:uncharacterized phiE125 gp8 family phage protein
MVLAELTTVQPSALPLAQFKNQLRMGTGFSDEGAEDTYLQQVLAAAVSSVEDWTGKALLTRSFAWSLTAWKDNHAQTLPIAPVNAISRVVLVDAEGAETDADADLYRLAADTHTPKLSAQGVCLPSVPTNGAVRIEMSAGFGPDWEDLPPSLAHAVIVLATTFYEQRSATAARGQIMPYSVSTLLQPWRRVRITMGGRG